MRFLVLIGSLLHADGLGLNTLRIATQRIATSSSAAAVDPRMVATATVGTVLPAVDANVEDLISELRPAIIELQSSSAVHVTEISGVESTTRFDSGDEGCVWTETADTVTVALQLQGLRGQPAACLDMHLASSRDAQHRGKGTATVTAFGRIMWSAILRGSLVVDACSVEMEDGMHMLPVLRVTARKLPGTPRWGGFIEEVEFNTLM
mmetsp:Transcript_11397/g.29196  ORF Transcript_11397/g.29196 Transcript_11397/m.29196 type:complete len:207 (+) Transcript_11397:48-668(+)